jgi:hypothetical protein
MEQIPAWFADNVWYVILCIFAVAIAVIAFVLVFNRNSKAVPSEAPAPEAKTPKQPKTKEPNTIIYDKETGKELSREFAEKPYGFRQYSVKDDKDFFLLTEDNNKQRKFVEPNTLVLDQVKGRHLEYIPNPEGQQWKWNGEYFYLYKRKRGEELVVVEPRLDFDKVTLPEKMYRANNPPGMELIFAMSNQRWHQASVIAAFVLLGCLGLLIMVEGANLSKPPSSAMIVVGGLLFGLVQGNGHKPGITKDGFFENTFSSSHMPSALRMFGEAGKTVEEAVRRAHIRSWEELNACALFYSWCDEFNCERHKKLLQFRLVGSDSIQAEAMSKLLKAVVGDLGKEGAHKGGKGLGVFSKQDSEQGGEP